MGFCGINDKKTLYKHYLNNRYQRVSINSKKCNSTVLYKWLEIKHGVQQGTIFGPLLFLLRILDLLKMINNESVPILYVDDTSILFTHSNPINFNINIRKVFLNFR